MDESERTSRCGAETGSVWGILLFPGSSLPARVTTHEAQVTSLQDTPIPLSLIPLRGLRMGNTAHVQPHS